MSRHLLDETDGHPAGLSGLAAKATMMGRLLSRSTRKSKRPVAATPRGSDPTALRHTPSRHRAAVVAGASLLALLVVFGLWWRSAPGRSLAGREPARSVLLITIDTLRADAVGAYGDTAATTRWMDRLAKGGVRFDDAHAHNVVTLPSHANILSGRYPLVHGVRDNSGYRFPAGVETLATILEGQGYRTGAFVSAFPLAARFGLARGFDVYDDRFVDAEPRPAFLVQERKGADTVRRAREWLAAQQAPPSFCWVHLYEPHFPYEPPEPFAARFAAAPYNGEVAAADAALGPLLDPILAEGDKGRTLVVLTSDHGESLGEHGEATHGIFAYEATLKVPLILYQPGLLAPRVVPHPARHVDLAPTILDALGLAAPEGLDGRSLLDVAAGRAPATTTTSYFEALGGSLNRGWAPLHGVIHDRTKYVELPLPELYRLDGDPGETRNLASSEPQQLEALRAILAPLRAIDQGGPRSQETAESRERLRSLGYLTAAAAPKERYTVEDDPKRLIALDTMLQEVVSLHLEGRTAAALARCRDVVRRRQGMALSLLHLAQLEREAGNLVAAVAALRQAVASNPGDDVALALLGASLTQAGRAHEAADVLAVAARRRDPDVEVLATRALALAKLGSQQEALAELARARALEPQNAMLLVNVGTVHFMGGDPVRAREAFLAALASNPSLARAHSSLGMLAAEAGGIDEAVEHWRRALALDPREHEKLLGLSFLLWRQGRTKEARPCFELFVASAPPARYGKEIERVRALLAQRSR